MPTFLADVERLGNTRVPRRLGVVDRRNESRPGDLKCEPGGVRTRNASCTPGLVHASVGDASGRSVPDARTVICLFLPFRADCCSPKKLRNLLICGEFAMARPGLEPGTPRFSVVRSLGLNPVDLQGIQPARPISRASGLSRTLRPFGGRYGRWCGPSAFSSGASSAGPEGSPRPSEPGSADWSGQALVTTVNLRLGS